MTKLSILIFIFFSFFVGNQAVKYAKELYNDIGTKAEEMKYWRPVQEDGNSMIVYVGVTLIQVMNLDEKSKVITMSVWLRQIWKNKYLTWDPAKYGGHKSIYLPPSDMWHPDIVLFNNADGKYETQFPNKPVLYYNGVVDWLSPAIFQSTCDINVRYFPYDEQTCYLDFGSWTYNKNQVKLLHIKHLEALLERSSLSVGSERWNTLTNYSQKRSFENGIYLMNYYKSGEWDLMQTPVLMLDGQDHTVYDTIRFGVRIRRKILFYNLNLIFPMIGMSALAAISFYTPVDSGEKVTFSTMILLTITVFFVMIAEDMPPTSLVIPIIDQYLIISFLMIIGSVLSSVVVLNFHSRSYITDKTMPTYIRVVLLDFLPKVLFMDRPPKEEKLPTLLQEFRKFNKRKGSQASTEHISTFSKENFAKLLTLLTKCVRKTNDESEHEDIELNDLNAEYLPKIKSQLEEARQIVSDIANHFANEIEYEKITNDWKYAAMVLDRLLLFVFCFIFTTVTIACFQSPSLHDNSLPIKESLYNDSNFNMLLFKLL